MTKVIKSDAINVRGERSVLDVELVLLTGFDFNNSPSHGAGLGIACGATSRRKSGAGVLQEGIM